MLQCWVYKLQYYGRRQTILTSAWATREKKQKKTNAEATKRELQQREFENFNYLKYNPLIKPSKINIKDEPPTLLRKLELLHPSHTQYLRRKLAARVPSNTKQTSSNRDKEIENIKNHMNLLKQNLMQHDMQECKSNLDILRIKKYTRSKKTSRWPLPQRAILKSTSVCKRFVQEAM